MFKLLIFCFTFVSLIGCSTTDPLSNQTAKQLTQVNRNISTSQKEILTSIEQHCSLTISKVKQEVSALVKDELKNIKPPMNSPTTDHLNDVQITECKGSSQESKDNLFENMVLMGEVEKIYLVKEKITFDARVDTGAVSSSLGVFNATKFERDGENWIRFTLTPNKESQMYEYPIVRMIKIAQRSGTPADNRPVIELQFKLGEQSYVSNFNLANRSHLEFQVLIGREFLRDIAIVDVSKKYVIGGK